MMMKEKLDPTGAYNPVFLSFDVTRSNKPNSPQGWGVVFVDIDTDL